MKTVTVHTSFNPADAQLVRARLECAGFHPAILHELSSLSLEGYAMAAGGILVQVPEEEASEATSFLESSTPANHDPQEPH
ncbi:hypothetical protein EG834_09145 [bacterium]|nr:hypothetical protein [bacterium]